MNDWKGIWLSITGSDSTEEVAGVGLLCSFPVEADIPELGCEGRLLTWGLY